MEKVKKVKVDITEALANIRSGPVTKRAEGLTVVKSTLEKIRHNSNGENLEDKAWHGVLEALFYAAKVECSTYANASKPTSKTKSASRLSECASVLDTAVKVGVRKLRFKTVRALLEHISQTLPTSDGTYCEPLVAGYFRALRTVFEYSPHPEHLLKEDWHDAIDFCNACIRDLNLPATETNSSFSRGVDDHGSSTRLASRSATLSFHRKGLRDPGSQGSQLRGSAEDLVLCVRHLTAAPNAPIFEKASVTLNSMLDLLEMSPQLSTTQQAAFESINSIIIRIATDDTSLVLQTLKRLFPLIRRFWQAKSAGLKVMLTSMLYGEEFLARLLTSDEDGDCKADLLGILGVLRVEYCKRIEREQLQLDDIDLSDHIFRSDRYMPMSTKACELRSGAHKAEQPWTILHLSASILTTIHAKNSVYVMQNGNPDMDPPLKRQRTAEALDEVLELMKASVAPDKLYALQVLMFVFDRLTVEIGDLERILHLLLLCASDDNGSIASWAIIALTCAAGQKAAHAVSFKEFWLSVWRLAARHITSTSTCRAACQFMAVSLDIGIVQYIDIADAANRTISSVDLDGPADCVDSAATMWSVLLISRGKDNPGRVFETSEQVLRWLFNRWNPSRVDDRHYAARIARMCPTHCIVRLIAVCLGVPPPSIGVRSSLNLGPLAQARLTCRSDEVPIQFLLLDKDRPFSIVQDEYPVFSPNLQIPLLGPRFQALYKTVLDFLIAEITTLFRQSFLAVSSEATGLNIDMVEVFSSLCIIAYALLSCPQAPDLRRREDLRSVTDQLTQRLRECITNDGEPQSLIRGVLDSYGVFLGPIATMSRGENILVDGALDMAQGFDAKFWRSFRSTESLKNTYFDQGIEFDDEFESQGSHGRMRASAAEISHDEIVAATDLLAFDNSITAKICFMASWDSAPQNDKSSAGAVASSLVAYLTSLKPHEFLSCRPFLRDLFGSSVPVEEKDASILFKYLGQNVLDPYEFERCEVSMGACLDIMTGLASLWINAGSTELSDYGSNLYEWFIKAALNHGISSPHVHICISSMLQRVIKVRPEYARSLSLPSARTSLFRVLQEGNIRVKFHVGNHISEIFGLFILKEHDNILEDVIRSLPSDVDWPEGIALRLYTLGHLAASWSTLLRRCVYAIFETPGNVPESAGHAERCLDHVSKSLGLQNSKEILRLFASQIIYTWLETQNLRSIPYMIFGYSSLSAFLRDVQSDVVGQVVMRGKVNEATQLVHDLGRPYESLLESSFSKASAYSIARDITIPPSQDNLAAGAEKGLRKHFGKERYLSLLTRSFPEILGIFYKAMDQEESIERAFQKRPAFARPYDAYRTTLSTSVVEKALPENQQPSFRAAYLIDEIEYLCHRGSYDMESIWSPSLYLYVFRELLNTIHPALGSLHACSVLRRIRILICMAGGTALSYYPIEMALHSLRPFLTDTHCADDTIGIVQYLLSNGASYLNEVPSFLAGLAVSTLTSMRAFLGTTQESTTQESQFKATMSKAHAFHVWFGESLDQYNSSHLSDDSAASFRALIRSARNTQTRGNPRKGTYESDLLQEILDDQLTGRNLLNQPSQDLILGLLCADFDVPPSFRDDFLGSDEKAAYYAPIVWKTYQRGSYGEGYSLWVGRVLGRAYAATGLVHRHMTLEIELDLAEGTTARASVGSRSSILNLLCDILLVDDRMAIVMAEETLRSIVTGAEETEYFVECEKVLPASLMPAMLWRQHSCPPIRSSSVDVETVQHSSAFDISQSASEWVQRLCISLVLTAIDDPILSQLPTILHTIEDLAEKAFPYILHLVLLKEANGHQATRRAMSEACQQWFRTCDQATTSYVKMLLKAILYLRTQTLPHETAKSDRSKWLELDYRQAAEAAAKCSMFKTSLLFLEISYSEAAKASRRSSAVKTDAPSGLLLHIFENIDEQDAFYGVQQPSNLSSMMACLEYEHAGFKSLSFRGAHYDSLVRLYSSEYEPDDESMVRVLDSLDLNGLSQSMLSKMSHTGPATVDSMLRTARKLEKWDISVPASHLSGAGTIFRVFQSINKSATSAAISSALDRGFSSSIKQLNSGGTADASVYTTLNSLAILVEIDEAVSSNGTAQLEEVYSRFDLRNDWMRSGSFEQISAILSCRETLFSSLSKNTRLQELLKTSQHDARSIESRALLASSNMSRRHEAPQNTLATATYLNQLIKPSEEVGVNIKAAVQFESANVLWDQGEMTASIRMLQDLRTDIASSSSFIHVGKPKLLAKLGHQISEARLEKPDEIIKQYLTPAIKELHGVSQGDEAGQVFHEFASFCDQQLQNPDSLEDFRRIERLRNRKEAEVNDLEKMIRSSGSQARERDNLKTHRAKAKQWFDLDDREYQRLRDSREAFLRQSLENYLLCLKACDRYDNDALRFSALWLEHWDNEIANEAVSKHVAKVGSRKFAPLMNQWSSRLLDAPDAFQTLLSSLVLRICIDHPYHGMYQIFAGSKTKGGKDETALARHAAANKIVEQLKSNKRSASTWLAIHNTNISFVRFAAEKIDDSKIKQGAKVPLRRTATGQRLEQDIQNLKIPPPTMRIDLRADCSYINVPHISKFLPEFTLASGISMPKIVTALGTDGLKYKQLFKGGNDDLRQDSIMEQVFDQVSSLLLSQRTTRQRNLRIRTYKVLPLTATSGVIEFVPNTIPLHDYLMPAHQRHFPKDLKPNICRKHIAEAQPKSVDHRIKTFRTVCDHFHPVLRYFFMERFESPDDWFDKRLAYTRSTAAISILGHVLGLGDRHGHNILLDEKTGEVVHIDLGIAFEQGRVLPVPEVVPFRLTRDLVDGMGITRTEGVFRRCCEFTLAALRTESYSIMTILDVLRYDPLYSWSLSPLRLKKMQDAQTEAPTADAGATGIDGAKRADNEPGEADRALTVVKKKLSRSLSVQATVNELIQNATDERNLAVLFCGWAAYA